MIQSIGLQSVGVSVPDRVLTNDHWRRHYPEMISDVEGRIWMWRKPMEWTDGSEAFNREMAPYVRDLDGLTLRRVLGLIALLETLNGSDLPNPVIRERGPQ